MGFCSTKARSVATLGLMALLACASLGLIASVVVAAAVAAGWLNQPQSLVAGSLTKAALFAALAAGAVFSLRGSLRVQASAACPAVPPRLESHQAWFMAVLLIAACTLILPRLNTYPYPEPDELHHLIVARNLAVYGEYASGHPETGFIRYDPYDSVGPPVILPVAAALRLAGTTLAAGRLPIVLSFLLLMMLMSRLFAPVLGWPAALLGSALVLCAWGSIYLARSVYGEVPALALFTASLLCWRRSMRPRRGVFAALAAILLGLAILAKAILVLSVFPFAVVVVADRWTHRRLRAPQILLPPLGVALIYGSWTLTKAFDARAASGESTLGLYQHYLMVGWGGLQPALAWIAANQLVFLAGALLSVAYLAPLMLERRDPAVLVALLTAILYLFWWCFFTDAHIPRYLWFSIAILTFPFAFLLWNLARISWSPAGHPRWTRWASMLAVVGLIVPFGPLVAYEVDRIYGHADVGTDERRVLDHVAHLPATTRMATTWWPFERWANFFLNRPVPTVDNVMDAFAENDVIISKGYTDADLLNPHIAARKMGPYVVYRKEP